MMFPRSLAILAFLVSHPAHAYEHPPTGYGAVTTSLYRGGRPGTWDEMGFLAHNGFHTIVNLQGGGWQFIPGEQPGAIEGQKRAAEQYGMQFVNIPVAVGKRPDEASAKQLVDVVRVLEDPALQPIYVHCNVGVDRTGLVIAAYRILHQNCSFEQARREMFRKGAPWTPIVEGRNMDLLRELAASPESFGHPRGSEPCPLR